MAYDENFSSMVNVVGTVLTFTACYLAGRLNYSWLWIAILTVFAALKMKLWRDRQRRIALLQFTAGREKEYVTHMLQGKIGELSSWVKFPDAEKVGWVNQICEQLWPYIGEYAKQFTRDYVETAVKENLPDALKSFRFENIKLGDKPLQMHSVTTHIGKHHQDRITIDLDLKYAGDAVFGISVGAIKAGITRIQFKGLLRIVLEPLVVKPPLASAVTAFFLNLPTIDFDLTGAGNCAEGPGIIRALRKAVDSQVANFTVLPNMISYPLIEDFEMPTLLSQPPDAIVRVQIVGAKQLLASDFGFFHTASSDPYVKISIGATKFRTKVIKRNLNPTWNEYFEASVSYVVGQKILIEVYDHDRASNDDCLGSLAIDLLELRQKLFIDEWFVLNNVKTGEVYIRAHWLALSAILPTRDIKIHHDIPQYPLNFPNHSTAALMVYVHSGSIQSAPRTLPSTYIEVRVGDTVHQTTKQYKTINPVYMQKFVFLLPSIKYSTLAVKMKSDASKKDSYGQLELPCSALLERPNMDAYQETWTLRTGDKAPVKLIMTLRLRICVT